MRSQTLPSLERASHQRMRVARIQLHSSISHLCPPSLMLRMLIWLQTLKTQIYQPHRCIKIKSKKKKSVSCHGNRVPHENRKLRVPPPSGVLTYCGRHHQAFESLLQLYEARADYEELCIPMCMLPATISNNVPGTDLSLGADTALNAIVEVRRETPTRLELSAAPPLKR